ncbi:MAG: peptide-methionine (S)-S-oxide reductase, partial [Candidatus Melainabacteria bacterium]|nr:peptide-methionine (S)-S-oxide reductase [Candidatus Melainabacteria bacterium]
PKVVSFKDVIMQYVKLFRPSRYKGEETSQYRAAIFYENDRQKFEGGEVLKECGFDEQECARLLEPASVFFAAEVYHQKYYEKATLGGLRR